MVMMILMFLDVWLFHWHSRSPEHQEKEPVMSLTSFGEHYVFFFNSILACTFIDERDSVISGELVKGEKPLIQVCSFTVSPVEG